MGRIEILEKLNRELEKDIREECQLVYIMSRIRKVLEIKNEKEKYKFLKFYCDWVLHNKLSYKNTTELLADLFEPDIDCKQSGKENAIRIKSNHDSFFKFSSLKQELDIFFKEYELSLNLLNKNWVSFRKTLLEIIKECPVEFDSEILEKLELVKNKDGNYCYKFSLVGRKDKPVVKLNLK